MAVGVEAAAGVDDDVPDTEAVEEDADEEEDEDEEEEADDDELASALSSASSRLYCAYSARACAVIGSRL